MTGAKKELDDASESKRIYLETDLNINKNILAQHHRRTFLALILTVHHE